jgi:hypothetical protein
MGTAGLEKGLVEAESLAREIFLEDTSTSIDTAARLIHDGCHRSLHKSAITRIRQEVRQTIAASTPQHEPIVVEEEGFVNHPRLVGSEEGVVDIKKGRANVDTESKRKYLGDWAMNNPLSTIREARDALRKEFGETLGTSYIADTLKAARNLMAEERKKTVGETLVISPQKPLREIAREVAVIMKSAGIKSMRINADGSVDFEAALTLSS